VLSKQDAIFGLALAGLVMFISRVIMEPRLLRRGNAFLSLSLFPIPVILAEYLRNRFDRSFFFANTGVYTRVLDPYSILKTFLEYPGAELSRRIFFVTVATLIVLIALIIYSKRNPTSLRNKSELVRGMFTSMAVIAFAVGLRFPYLILPYKQIDWYSNYWLLLDFAALASLIRLLLIYSKPLTRVVVSLALSFCLFLSSPVLGSIDSTIGGRSRVEGWYVQRVRENQNIVDFLNTNALEINKYECMKVLNTNFLTPWIFDSGSYLESLLGSKIKWSVEVSEDTITFIQQFPEFGYMSSFSNTQDIAIYATGESPELRNCGVIRFDGDFSSKGRLIEMNN
jgi:hypothetical protein